MEDERLANFAAECGIEKLIFIEIDVYIYINYRYIYIYIHTRYKLCRREGDNDETKST